MVFSNHFQIIWTEILKHTLSKGNIRINPQALITQHNNYQHSTIPVLAILSHPCTVLLLKYFKINFRDNILLHISSSEYFSSW